MPVTSYYSVGGELLGEETGGVRLDYLTDALGSVTGTVTQAGVVENTYRYKPYGEQLSKTGTGSDPKFLWNGKWGYRHFNQYIRARHYNAKTGSWYSEDPFNAKYINMKNSSIRLILHNYVYSRNSPVFAIDPTGLQAVNEQIPPFHLPEDCSSADAITACNYQTGYMETRICDRQCDAPCTDAHEGQHRNDRAKCCNKYAECVSKKGFGGCLDKYRKWIGETRQWSECRAYKSGKDCREAQFRNQGCSWSSKCDSNCCSVLKKAIHRDNRLMSPISGGYDCKNYGDYWGPAPSKCPF